MARRLIEVSPAGEDVGFLQDQLLPDQPMLERRRPAAAGAGVDLFEPQRGLALVVDQPVAFLPEAELALVVVLRGGEGDLYGAGAVAGDEEAHLLVAGVEELV